MALAPAGRLPLYAELEQETRQVCEDVILNSKKDETPLKRFMAFLNFRSSDGTVPDGALGRRKTVRGTGRNSEAPGCRAKHRVG